MTRPGGKTRSIALLVLTQIAVMSLWFTSSAILPDMLREVAISPRDQALLASAVQAGFVIGALVSAILGLSDRLDPRQFFMACGVAAAGANAALLIVPVGGTEAIGLRFLTGLLLAGVYPVGMKIAVGWGTADRGLLVGLLVGALTIGAAAPHLFSFLGGAEWRVTVIAVSGIAALGALGILLTRLGAHHAKAAAFSPRAILVAWTNKRIRYTYFGYLGHMWELYAMWAWIGVAAAASYAATMPLENATELAKLTAFAAIALGGIACVPAGAIADRIGKAQLTIIAMVVSGAAALATAATFGGPAWITFAVVMVWGISIIPDSAQFSALVADNGPPDLAGSLMTLQVALGFTLTILTVQMTPVLAATFGWPPILAVMAFGPAFGIYSMWRFTRLAQ